MKFLQSAFINSLLAATVLCQIAFIGFPPDGTTVKAGSNITVEVDRHPSLSSFQEVAIVLGVAQCGTRAPDCLPPDEVFGSIVYNGPFHPAIESGVPFNVPHQNFTITIPATFSGKVQLNFAHLTMIGAGPFPQFETSNITLNVQP